ncbi:hypothetical protein HV211_15160 [Citrobacter freundii]|uniref:hypothetical protein n=1 Tax=Citrobacter freundii TaxID=546 RepID=UPI0015E94BCD|nr:hypothetical protein [Citrobacter freundii]QLY61734.1 hypothetical protein HV211_15160 [Citrobacter freundii]
MESFFINNKKISIKSLKYKSKEIQLEVMRNWFFDNFEDPANSCPYESREGGYFYIYGGPYNADEELQDKFGAYVKDKYIQELTDELQDICFDWSGNSSNAAGWYEEDLYDVVTSSKEPYNNFSENLYKIRSLAASQFDDEHKTHLLSILFTNVITALETLYVELFTNSIEEDKSFIINYIQVGGANFKVSKPMTAMPFLEGSIEELKSQIIKEVKEHLIDASWHSTEQVVKRYKLTFGIKAQSDWPIDAVEKATVIRNHLIHRGGKNKEGIPVVITEKDLEELLGHSALLGEKLYTSLNKAIQERIITIEKEF